MSHPVLVFGGLSRTRTVSGLLLRCLGESTHGRILPLGGSMGTWCDDVELEHRERLASVGKENGDGLDVGAIAPANFVIGTFPTSITISAV